MNKNARKLIPAVAMLLVSASMLSTASYAWFSMNNKVTASGMEVNVAAPANLMISTDATDWKTSVSGTLATTSKLLGHASSADGSELFTVDPKKANEDGTLQDDADIVKVDNSTYANVYGITGTAGYADYTFYLATTSTSIMKVTLDTETTLFTSTKDTGKVLMPAMRFAVLTGETPTKPTSGKNVWCGETNNSTETEAFNAEGKANVATKLMTEKFVANTQLIELAAGTAGNYGSATKVTIRIWVEGTDAAAKNANITALKDYTLTVGFMVVS